MQPGAGDFAELFRALHLQRGSSEERAILDRFRRGVFPDVNPATVRTTLSGIVTKLQVHGKHNHADLLKRAIASLPHHGEHDGSFAAVFLELSRNPLALDLAQVDATRSESKSNAVCLEDAIDAVLTPPDRSLTLWELERAASEDSGDDDPQAVPEPRPTRSVDPLHGAASVHPHSSNALLIATPASEQRQRCAPPSLSSESALVDAALDALLGAPITIGASAGVLRGGERSKPRRAALDPTAAAIACALAAGEAACVGIGGATSDGLDRACGAWAAQAALASPPTKGSWPPTRPVFSGDPQASKTSLLAPPHRLTDDLRTLVLGALEESPVAVLCALGRRVLEACSPAFLDLHPSALQQEAHSRLLQSRQLPGEASALSRGAFVVDPTQASMLEVLVQVANDLARTQWLCDAVLASPDNAAQHYLAATLRATRQAVFPDAPTLHQVPALHSMPPLWGSVSRQLARSILENVGEIRAYIGCVQSCHREHVAGAAPDSAFAHSSSLAVDADAIPPQITLLGLYEWVSVHVKPQAELVARLAALSFDSALDSPSRLAPAVSHALAADPQHLLPAPAPDATPYSASSSRQLAYRLACLHVHAPWASCCAMDAVSYALERELQTRVYFNEAEEQKRPPVFRLVTPLSQFPVLPHRATSLARIFVALLRPLLCKVDVLVMEPCPRSSDLLDLPVLRVGVLQVRGDCVRSVRGAGGRSYASVGVQ
jgi:hypothetical protein